MKIQEILYLIGTEIIQIGPFKAEKIGFKDFNFHFIVWCLSSDENRERSSSAPFVGKTGRRSFPTEAGDLQGGAEH